MKTSRVITLVLVAVTTLFCCLPASALDVANSYSYSNVIDNNLTQYLNVSVMYADDESYAYGTDSDVVQYYDAPTYQALVNYRVKNTSDQDANLNVSYIALDFGLQASGYNVIGVEYVSGALEPYYVSISDFRLQQVDGTSTTVIVPAGGYISGTFIIHLQETYDNSSGTHTQYPAFSNFNTWDSFSPTYGDYNSSVIDYVSDIYVELIEQGIEDQELYNSILNAILHKTNISSFANNQYTSIYDSSFTIMDSPSTIDMRVIAPRPHLYIADFEVNDQSGNSGSLNLYCQPIYFVIRSINNTDNTYQLSSNRFAFNYSVTNSNTNLTYYSYDFELISSENILATDVSNNSITIQFTNKYNNFAIIPSADNSYMLLKVNYYYISGNYDSSFDPINTGVPSISITNLPSLSASLFSQKWYYSIYKNFADIRDRIQAILDAYTSNQPAADEVSDQSDDLASETQNQHQQEQSYYSDTNTALENSGLPDYSFNSQQTGGLSGVSDDFVRVWNACGALNSVFVFSLTLSLALFILRHRRRL